MSKLKPVLFAAIVSILASCSTAPKASDKTITESEAREFLSKRCSLVGSGSAALKGLSGEILMRSSTREFKGQYPASIHFSNKGEFVLEVTNVIGGTVAMLKGNSESIEIISPSRPRFNRKSVKSYMGLPVKLLLQLLHGDLPCPDLTDVRSEGSRILVSDGHFRWEFERTDESSGVVPYRVRVLEGAGQKVEMLIDRWNQGESYAEKVKVTTPEGDLKWTWRSRTLE